MISNKQPKGRSGKLKQPAGNFGNFPEPTLSIPNKPGGIGPTHTHGSYSTGKPVGTKIN